MELNKRKNIIVCISAIFLFAALIDGWPYGYFMFLRLIVFASAAYLAWMAYEHEKEKWMWSFGCLAVLFNPFIPIHLNRDLWVIIDFATGVFLVASVFALKFNRKHAKSSKST